MADQYWEEIVQPGDRASAFAKEICFQSHGNNRVVRIVPVQPGNFRGPVNFLWRQNLLHEMANFEVSPTGEVTHWELAESVENDGAGGKPQFHTLLGDETAFRGLGWEPIVMVADDFARSGRMPVVIDNEINAKRITNENFHLFQALMSGYGEALAASRLVNITGEVAIMKHSITAFCDTGSLEQMILTWGASCIGLARKSMMIDWSQVVPGLPIVGFWEPGYRCNGGTFFTNLIQSAWGSDPEKVFRSGSAREFIRDLTVPSKSYARFINDLQGWQENGSAGPARARMLGISHITGGGVWGKFREMLPPNVGAHLDKMPRPADVLLEAQRFVWGGTNHLSDWKAYGTLHGGCGMLMVTDDESLPTILSSAVEYGIEATLVGHTTQSENREVLIQSRFIQKKELSSERPE